jgi:MFS family permease
MLEILKKIRSLLQGNLGVMVLSSGLWNLGGNMVWPFFSLYVLELGGNYVEIGFIAALSSLVQVIPTFIGGYLSDRVGRRKLVYVMSFLLALNEILKGFAPDFRFLFFTAALGGIWTGLREPSFHSVIADSTAIENRALGYALWRVVPPMMGVFSPFLMGLLMENMAC